MRPCFHPTTSTVSPAHGDCSYTPAKIKRETPCLSATTSKDPTPTALWANFFHDNQTEKSNQNIPLADPRCCFSSQAVCWSTIFYLPRKWIICFMLFALLLFVFTLSTARAVPIKWKIWCLLCKIKQTFDLFSKNNPLPNRNNLVNIKFQFSTRKLFIQRDLKH